MIIFLLIICIIILAAAIYNRYFPVKNVPCIENKDPNTVIVDIRDYNESSRDIPHDALNIPYAYLRRFSKEISYDKIHVIASNQLELNLGLRFFKRKGFTVISYEIVDCPCKKKRGVQHGI